MIKFHLVQFFLLCEYAIFGTEKVCFGAVVFDAFYYSCKESIKNPPGEKWHNLPSTSTLWSVIKKFDSFGTLCDRRQGKKHSSNVCDVRRVKHLYSRKQRISLRVASRKFDISAYPIRNILRLRLLKKSYKTKFALQLIESQHKVRISACKAFLSKKAILKHV